MKQKFSILLTACAVSVATACTPHTATVDRQMVAEPDPIGLRLASAVDRASAALQTLASVEQARNPAASVQAAPNAPQELRRVVSLDWNGPIEPVVRKLADRAGYKFQILGDTPPVPIVVTVRSVEKSVIDVLRDIGLQAGSRADIIVDAERRMVEINYAPIADG